MSFNDLPTKLLARFLMEAKMQAYVSASVEEIHKGGKKVYKLFCHGGLVE